MSTTLQLSYPWYHALLAHANGLTFIRERDPKAPNSGEGVEACQKTTHNEPPASWCCSYTVKCFLDLFGSAWPVKRSGACEIVRQDYKARGALITHAEAIQLVKDGVAGAGAGWQFFTVSMVPDGKGGTKEHAHHTGFVGQLLTNNTIRAMEADGRFYTTEANASDPSKPPSDNGDGAYAGRLRGVPTKDAKRYYFGRPELVQVP